MELQPFTVESRDENGKGPAGRSRHQGNVPGVIYGNKQENVSIVVSIKELDLLMHGGQGEHALVDLTVTGNDAHNGPVILKDVQHHPVSGKALHFDFQRINLNKPIVTVIPIQLDGRSVGVVAGGMIDHHIREVQIECLPLDTPAAILGDITNVDIGERLHISDLTLPENVTLLSDPGLAVVSIHQPRVATVETTVAEEGEETEATEEDSAE
jgi:large subunit ribosomal protein L25